MRSIMHSCRSAKFHKNFSLNFKLNNLNWSLIPQSSEVTDYLGQLCFSAQSKCCRWVMSYRKGDLPVSQTITKYRPVFFPFRNKLLNNFKPKITRGMDNVGLNYAYTVYHWSNYQVFSLCAGGSCWL